MASVEATWLTQSLENPDVLAGSKLQHAQAVALQMRLKFNFLRVSFLGLYRTPSYIWFNQPGFPPFKDFPAGSVLQPEMFAAIGLDYHIAPIKLTVGAIGGAQLPATYRQPTPMVGGSIVGTRTIVFRDVGQPNILPTNQVTRPIVSAKLNFRFDLSEYFAAIGELYYTWDSNRTRFRDNVSGIAEPVFEPPHAIGFNAMLQARF
jgi:hypothetical protein